MRHLTIIGDPTVSGCLAAYPSWVNLLHSRLYGGLMQIDRIHHVAKVFDPLVNLRTGLRLWWASWWRPWSRL